MRATCFAVLTGAALAGPAPVAASVTFDGLQVAAYAGTYATDGTTVKTDNQSYLSGNLYAIQPLFAASVQSTSRVDPARSDAGNSTNLTFANPGSLALSVQNTSALTLPTAASYGNTAASGQVNYRFTVTAERAFSLSHEFTTSSPFVSSSAVLFRTSGGLMDPPVFRRDGAGALAAATGVLAPGPISCSSQPHQA